MVSVGVPNKWERFKDGILRAFYGVKGRRSEGDI